MTLQKNQENLLIAALSAFIQEDGFSHFSYDNLSKCGIGKDTIKHILNRLEQKNQIINKTVNGFFNKYIILNPRQCPDFVFNEELPCGAKYFLLNCFDNLKGFNRRSIRLVVKELNNGIEKDYKSESNYNTIIKKCFKKDLFEVLSEVVFITKNPEHSKYPLLKLEEGYQIDTSNQEYTHNIISEKERRQRKKENLLKQGIHIYLYDKVCKRVKKCGNKNIKNLLTPEDILTVWTNQKGLDYYTGDSLENNLEASIDRIDSNKDYHIDNIVITTVNINTSKNDMSISDFVQMCEKIAKHMKNKIKEYS